MKTEQHLLLGDSKDRLKELKDESIDLLATDPPYGIQFMGLDFDKV
jgi:DNA modification methylase